MLLLVVSNLPNETKDAARNCYGLACGLIFSKEKFKENLDVEVLAMQSGELSNLQLESVAD